MSDNWEDWENQDFVIPVLSIQNKEQLKQLEERKLVEESDNALTKDLFSNYKKEFIRKVEQENIVISKNKAPKKTTYSKQKENEKKQKEFSKKNKEKKLKKIREKEIFGEVEENNKYAKYEDMFY